MTIQDVADLLGVSKKKVWTAVKNGQLEAEKAERGKAWRYSVSEDAAEAYRMLVESSDDSLSWETVLEPDETETQRNETGNVSAETQRNGNETGGNDARPIRELFDRLEMSHRKQIFLEMQLQQSQRLLCEVNEDQHEREARVSEAVAKAEVARLQAEQALLEAELAHKETAQAKLELDSLKTEMASKEAIWSEKRRPWYKKIFSKTS